MENLLDDDIQQNPQKPVNLIPINGETHFVPWAVLNEQEQLQRQQIADDTADLPLLPQ